VTKETVKSRQRIVSHTKSDMEKLLHIRCLV
jgi:hypothetical protein